MNADADVIERSLSDMVFHAGGANSPSLSHAAWLLGQMMRWGHIEPTVDIPATARAVYRPDLYAKAAGALGLEAPEAVAPAPFGPPEGARAAAAAAPLSRIAAG